MDNIQKYNNYIVTISGCEYRWDMDWSIGFIYHLYTPLGTTCNYSAIDNLHKSQITTATVKPSSACWLFNSCSLATASNNGGSSASRAHVVTVRRISCNWTLSTVNSTTAPSLLSLPCKARFSCQPSTDWVPGWRPLHSKPLVFSSQADFQLATDLPPNYFTSIHFTQLKWSNCVQDNSSARTTSKNPFYYCACYFPRERVYRDVA
jgi:hypothetical protein